jgi:hypothetical protein
LLQVVGNTPVKEETTTEEKDFEGYEKLDKFKAGDWWWYKNRMISIAKKGQMVEIEQNFQYCLNEDNTVLCEICYSDKDVMKFNDWSLNCSFYLARPVLHVKLGSGEGSFSDNLSLVGVTLPIAPPPPVDTTDDNLARIKAYFTKPDSYFRSHQKPNGQKNVEQIVYVDVTIDQVTAVDTVEERFGAKVTFTYNWKVSKEDIVEFVSEVDEENWRPMFVPPPLRVVNPAIGDGAADVEITYKPIHLIERHHVKAIKDYCAPDMKKDRHGKQVPNDELSFKEGDEMEIEGHVSDEHHKGVIDGEAGLIRADHVEKIDDGMKGNDGFMAVQKFTVIGDFWEPFELHNYPFDVQPLRIELETQQNMKNTIQYFPRASKLRQTRDVDGKKLSKIRDNEWEGMGSNTKVTFVQADGSITKGKYHIIAEAVASRNYAVHIYRVVIVMALFSIASISSLCAAEDVHVFDRLGVVFTLMLTATAYSLVIAAELPPLGYLTFLDKYILATFVYISIVGAEITCIEWVLSQHSDSLNRTLEEHGPIYYENCAYYDLVAWAVMHIFILLYVNLWVFRVENKKMWQLLGGIRTQAELVESIIEEKEENGVAI